VDEEGDLGDVVQEQGRPGRRGGRPHEVAVGGQRVDQAEPLDERPHRGLGSGEVAVVEPGNYASHISASMRQRLLDQGYTTEGSRYKEQMEAFLAKENDRSHYKESTEVADAFLHALTAEKPKLRYMVVPNQREADMTIRASMRRIVQQNADQPYTLDRDALIQLLDEALAKSDE